MGIVIQSEGLWWWSQSELQGQRWGTKCNHLVQRTREACTRVRPRGQGGAKGPGWRARRQAWAAGPGLEWRQWALRTQNWRDCDPCRGPLSGRGGHFFPPCWNPLMLDYRALGDCVCTPCLGPGFSLHWGPSSNLRGVPLTVGRPCGSASHPGSQWLAVIVWHLRDSEEPHASPPKRKTLPPPAV